MEAAARTIGSASAAPLPSPSRRPMPSAGVAPSASASTSPPRTADGSSCSAVAKSKCERHEGRIRTAHSAATPLMKPSTTAATPRSSASRNAPVIAASSRPPTRRSASRAREAPQRGPAERRGSLCASHARATVSSLCLSPPSSRPVPRPQQSAGEAPVRLASSAAAAVVLPIPTSPTATTLACRADTSPATADRPTSIARESSASSIAGAVRKSAVPQATFWCSTLIEWFASAR
mmetsp:Transcript_27903/g.89507  ORF Transcript_27903/g.89507 Transcript_27903/m.89507 type:complete len:235 (-) Transcript_27903:212-916(-)